MTLTIEIEDNLQKSLEKMAGQSGRQVDQFVVEIIDDYLGKKFAENREIARLMKASETSFNEWDNQEDAVYDHL